MKIHLFRCSEPDLYYLSDAIHITKLVDCLNKYSPYKVEKIQTFSIISNFKEHEINSDVNVLINTFFNYFNHFFKEFNTHSTWYKLDESNLLRVTDYLNTLKVIRINKPKIIDTKLFRCNKCNKDFTSDTYLERHYQHCQGLKCEKCEKTFTKKHNYINHLKNCGEFKCEKCSKIFNSRYKYLKHLNICS